jgi:hypothetical protein
MSLSARGLDGRGAIERIGLGVLVVAWRVIRLPVLALVVILEPIITFVLAGLALLGVLTSILFKLVGPADFPVWTMLGISIGFVMVLTLVHALIRLLSA